MYRDAREISVFKSVPAGIDVTLTPLRVLGLAASASASERTLTCVFNCEEGTFMLSVYTPQSKSAIEKIMLKAAKKDRWIYARGVWADEPVEGISGERYTPLFGEIGIV
jgi:exonuclease III